MAGPSEVREVAAPPKLTGSNEFELEETLEPN